MSRAPDPAAGGTVRPCCPVCGAAAVENRCKLVCPRCRLVLENCNGD